MDAKVRQKIYLVFAPTAILMAIMFVVFSNLPRIFTISNLVGVIALAIIGYLYNFRGKFTLKTTNVNNIRAYRNFSLLTIVIALISAVFSTFIILSNKELIPGVEVYSALIAITLVLSHYRVIKYLSP
ncbi:hypothetical protein [Acidianus sp. RZ1]|uniref:hypothetical protein n=1 Tax=Acidianus sp. RZ1 TaxID=1540082 RepID=UPI001491815F|nr:hypothetical protein [Acidianus sp. RZ1]NON61697.1 hypothetical protein [Acidianus sp. RZ1]